MIYRIFVEKKDNLQAKKVKEDICNLLKISVSDVRSFIRYDVEGMTKEQFASAVPCVFSEPPVDNVYNEEISLGKDYEVYTLLKASIKNSLKELKSILSTPLKAKR